MKTKKPTDNTTEKTTEQDNTMVVSADTLYTVEYTITALPNILQQLETILTDNYTLFNRLARKAIIPALIIEHPPTDDVVEILEETPTPPPVEKAAPKKSSSSQKPTKNEATRTRKTKSN